jgi:hypothetical protein
LRITRLIVVAHGTCLTSELFSRWVRAAHVVLDLARGQGVSINQINASKVVYGIFMPMRFNT